MGWNAALLALRLGAVCPPPPTVGSDLR